MKRNLSIVLMFILSISLLVGCGSTNSSNSKNNANNDNFTDINATDSDETISNNQEKISVVTTIFPAYDFTREIAGDNVNLTMLLPPGSESHSFEPTTQDIITIQNCDVFIYVGGESDTWVDGILDSMDTSNMTIISMMELVDVVEEEIKEGMEDEDDHDHDSEDEHADEEETEYDEHIWTSPVNAIRITQAISDTLCKIDEVNADVFTKNTDAYVKELEDLDASFREVTQNATRRTMIFGDRFPFRYFVDEYDLDYYAAFPGCSTDTEASAKTIAFLIDKVSAENIPVVFYIEFSNEKIADTICEATAATKLLFHSCHNVTKDDLESGVTYLDLMKQNVENLREALS